MKNGASAQAPCHSGATLAQECQDPSFVTTSLNALSPAQIPVSQGVYLAHPKMKRAREMP